MGHCKIDFYNPYDCYLHDTPQKALFGENARFHSSGCVRVEDVDELAAWLLRDNGGWDLDTVHAAFESTNENINVPLTVQVPIHTTYITAWANRQGTVSFRDDVYEFDAAGKVNFEGLMRWTGRDGKSGEVLFEFTQIGAQMRVAAIDAATGTEVVVIAPAAATQLQMQNLALAKLRRSWRKHPRSLAGSRRKEKPGTWPGSRIS